jgi:hypothetical protein
MKFIAMAAVLFSMNAALAAKITTFTCSLKKIPGETFTFKIEGLNTNDMTSVAIDPEDDYAGMFTTKSKNEDIIAIVDTLNGQGIADPEVKTDRISFFGDQAGIDFVYFDLFKNSGYKKGFIRTEFNFGEAKDYSEVTCKLK